MKLGACDFGTKFDDMFLNLRIRLPMLMLHALYHHSAEWLKYWLSVCARRLMKFRNTCPAVGGTFVIEDAPDDRFVISRYDNPHRITVPVDLDSYESVIQYDDADQMRLRPYKL